MWSRIGLKVKLLAQTMPIWIAKIQNFDHDAYMLGWGVANFDANYTLFSLLRTKTTGAAGSFNLGRITDPKLDKLIDAILVEIDVKKRDAMIREALTITRDNFYYVPLHHQLRPWAMKKSVTTVYKSDDRPEARYAKVQ
jgi:peptide/nickel transport system substrate-binding protein